MKKKTTYSPRAWLVAFAMVLLLGGCVQDGLDTCYEAPGVTVSFTLNSEEDVTGLEGCQLATVYLFDEDGSLVSTDTINSPLPNQPYTLKKNLLAGTYTFVAWVNPVEPYRVDLGDVSDRRAHHSTARLRLTVPSGGLVDAAALPVLLHGKAVTTVETRAGSAASASATPVEIPLQQNTNLIRFTVRGLSPTSHSYRFKIADTNGIYTFDNEYIECEKFQYYAHATFPQSGGETLKGSLTMLRLDRNRSPEFTFRNATTGETLYPSYPGQITNLVKLIEKAYGVYHPDFTIKHTFDIELSFDPDLQATVTIDGWEVKEEGHEI